MASYAWKPSFQVTSQALVAVDRPKYSSWSTHEQYNWHLSQFTFSKMQGKYYKKSGAVFLILFMRTILFPWNPCLKPICVVLTSCAESLCSADGLHFHISIFYLPCVVLLLKIWGFLLLIYSRLLVQILSFLKNPRTHDSLLLHCLVPAGLISRAVYPTLFWKIHHRRA